MIYLSVYELWLSSALVHEAILVHGCASESTHNATSHAAGKRDNHDALHNEKFLDHISVARESPIISILINVVSGIIQWALVAIGVESSNSRQDDRSDSRRADAAQAACSKAHGGREEQAERGAEE